MSEYFFFATAFFVQAVANMGEFYAQYANNAKAAQCFQRSLDIYLQVRKSGLKTIYSHIRIQHNIVVLFPHIYF